MLKKPLHVFVDRIRGLSLDLCVGAFLSAEMARKVTSSDQSMLVSVLVICAVYVIYVVDHLYDYQKSLRSAYSHNFSLMHTSQRKIIISAALIMLLAVMLLIKIYSLPLLIYGMVMGAMVFVYYLLVILYKKQQISWYPREWIIAFVFTAGIWGYYLLHEISTENLLFATGFFMCMLLNTYLLAYFEKLEDDIENHFNILNYIGEEKANRHFLYLTITALLINGITVYVNWLVGVIMFVMTGYLLGVFIGRKKLLQHRNYGLITDAVLIFPAIYFIVMF